MEALKLEIKEVKKEIQKLYKSISSLSMRKAIRTVYGEIDQLSWDCDNRKNKKTVGKAISIAYLDNRISDARVALKTITDMDIHTTVNKYLDAVEPLVKELNSRKEYLESIQPNIAQTSLASIDSKEFNNYIMTLKNWEEAKLVDDVIFVNGKEVKDGEQVAVLVGRGKKIHSMGISKRYNEKTKENDIVISNGTRWFYSDLLVIDTLEKVPSEIKSKII